MALGDPIVGGVNVQCTLFFNLGKTGWTETYIANVNGGPNPLLSARGSMQRIILLRRTVLPIDVNLEALRVNYITNPGKSDIRYIPDFGLGGGNLAVPSANPKLCWSVISANEDQWVEDTRFYRAWVPTMIPYNGSGVIGIDPPIAVKTWAQALENILTGSVTFLGGNVKYVMKSFLRPGASVDYPRFELSKVNLDLSGRIEVTALTSAIGLAKIGDVLMVHVTRKKCVTGFSGRWRISAMRPEGGVNTVITLSQKPCCGDATKLEDVLGHAQVYRPAYYQISDFSLGRQMEKKTGRAFFVSAGHLPSRCC